MSVDGTPLRLVGQAIVKVDQPNAPRRNGWLEVLSRPQTEIPMQQWLKRVASTSFHLELDLTVTDAVIRWAGPGCSFSLLAINLTPSSLDADEFVDWLLGRLEDRPADAPRICLEVSESMPVIRSDRVLQNLAALSARGAVIALDDLGAGCAHYELLANGLANIIKLDRSLVQQATLAHRPEGIHLVQGLIDLADRVGCQTVLEGIETQAEWEATQKYFHHSGVYAQGYALHKPSALNLIGENQNAE